ncbi:MAG: hypothetical protein LWX02_13595, partial [Deltaproteobacteria bacterium]|nr:hypothetical protein [Deltaproteobacteria bacterium]
VHHRKGAEGSRGRDAIGGGRGFRQRVSVRSKESGSCGSGSVSTRVFRSGCGIRGRLRET